MKQNVADVNCVFEAGHKMDLFLNASSPSPAKASTSRLCVAACPSHQAGHARDVIKSEITTGAVSRNGSSLPHGTTAAFMSPPPPGDATRTLPSVLYADRYKRPVGGAEEGCPVERRVSVRQSESSFRYKEIVVKKCPCYTQIWLFSNTRMKNAINPQVL